MDFKVNFVWKLVNLKSLVEARKTEICSPVFTASPDQTSHSWYASLAWNLENLENFELFLHLKDEPLQNPISVKYNYKAYNTEGVLVAEETSDEPHIYKNSEGWGSSKPATIHRSKYNFESIERICLEIELFREKSIFTSRQIKPNTSMQPSQTPKEDLPKQITKNSQQDLKFCIVDHSQTDLRFDTHKEAIVNSFLLNQFYNWVKAHPTRKAPVYNTKERFHGFVVITCDNQLSVKFLKESVSKMGELWEGAKLGIVLPKELTLLWKVYLTIPISDTKDVGKDFGEMIQAVLKSQNPDIPVKNWKLHRVGNIFPSKVLLTFAVEEHTITRLQSNNSLSFVTGELVAEYRKTGGITYSLVRDNVESAIEFKLEEEEKQEYKQRLVNAFRNLG